MPSDQAAPEIPVAQRERLSRSQITILIIAAMAFFMEQLDSTVITTAIPAIAQSLGQPPIRLNLTIIGYILALAAGIPVSGWMADRFGAKRVFALAMAGFALASALCGLATSLPMLVAMRILQGLAAAQMSPVGRLLVLRTLPKRALVTGLAYMALPAMIGPALGPIVGGALTQYVSWRWIFYINIPVAVAGLLTVWRFVPEMPSKTPGRFDVLGFAICAAGLVLAQLSLENIGRHILPSWVPVLTLALTAGAFLLYRRHARRCREPLLDLVIFRRRTFRMAQTAGGAARAGVQTVPFLLPLMFQLGFGMGPLRSGLLTAVVTVGAMGIRPTAVAQLRWLGFDRLLVVASVVAALVIAGFALVGPATSWWLLIPLLVIYGVVRGTQLSTNATLGYSGVPARLLSSANTISSVVQQLSQSFGISLASAVLAFMAGENGVPRLRDFHLTFLIVAILPALATLGFLRLKPQDGAVASKHPRALAALNPGQRGRYARGEED